MAATKEREETQNLQQQDNRNPELDDFFGAAQRGPRAQRCTICGKKSTVRVHVGIKEILRQSEGHRDHGGDGRSRQATKSFCTEHGLVVYEEILGELVGDEA